MANWFGHFRTVTAHRHMVIRHCARAGILWRGLLHDMSKYSPTEFFIGAKLYTDGTRSPNEYERELYGYSKAWMHHKGRNKHHFEYWIDYNPTDKRAQPVPMPDIYVIEMVCDRIAASKIYMKDNYDDTKPLAYFMRGKSTRTIHPETSEKLEYILRLLAEQGEAVTFAYLRSMRKNAKKRKTEGFITA